MKRAVLLLALCLAGCHEAGTWQDDAKNFQRIFRVSQPKDVTVVHSRFWRSPHWSYEFEYFVQIQRNENFKKRLFEHNKLKEPETEDERKRITDCFQEKPAWFIPKPLDQYEVWIYSDEPGSHFRVFIDRDTGDIFVSDWLV
jgi:hypothetical protein